jgi:hypothetical protein
MPSCVSSGTSGKKLLRAVTRLLTAGALRSTKTPWDTESANADPSPLGSDDVHPPAPLRDDIASEPCRGPTSARAQRGDASDRWLPASARDGLSVAANLATKGDGTRTWQFKFRHLGKAPSRAREFRSRRCTHPFNKKRSLGVFDRLLLVGQKIYDKDWSVKKIYERIDDLSV